MLDWNWRILWNLLIFGAVVALATAFAVYAGTLRFALAGATLALLLQAALYGAGNRFGVHQHFNPSVPLYRASRWDNLFFRAVKAALEMLLLAGMAYLGIQHFPRPEAAWTFIGFGIIFTGVPLPLLAWAYVRKVIQPSMRTMRARRQPVVVAAASPPRAVAPPPAIGTQGSPTALPPAMPQAPAVSLTAPAGRVAAPQPIPRQAPPPDFGDSVL